MYLKEEGTTMKKSIPNLELTERDNQETSTFNRKVICLIIIKMPQSKIISQIAGEYPELSHQHQAH